MIIRNQKKEGTHFEVSFPMESHMGFVMVIWKKLDGIVSAHNKSDKVIERAAEDVCSTIERAA